MKLKTMTSIALVGGVIGSIINWITNWYLSDQIFLEYVLGAILFDLAFGITKHFIKHSFDFKELILGLLKKAFIVLGAIYLYNGFGAIITEESLVKTYFIISLRVGVFMYPSMSAFANMYIISGEKFPPKSIMERLHDFEDNGNIKDLINTDKK